MLTFSMSFANRQTATFLLPPTTYFWPHSSAQPTCAGARRHAGGASARFRQDIKARVGAYERWECPLCVAKILDMDHIFSYLWIRIFYIR